MSDYEAMRVKHMQENQRMLVELGLLSGAACASTSAAKLKKPSGKKRRATLKPPPATFVRRSSRRVQGAKADETASLALPAPEPDEVPIEEIVPQVGTAFPSFGGGSRAQFASQSHLRDSGAALGARLLCGHGHNVYVCLSVCLYSYQHPGPIPPVPWQQIRHHPSLLALFPRLLAVGSTREILP